MGGGRETTKMVVPETAYFLGSESETWAGKASGEEFIVVNRASNMYLPRVHGKQTFCA